MEISPDLFSSALFHLFTQGIFEEHLFDGCDELCSFKRFLLSLRDPETAARFLGYITELVEGSIGSDGRFYDWELSRET